MHHASLMLIHADADADADAASAIVCRYLGLAVWKMRRTELIYRN
jgi:hypothetical protein